MSRRFIMPIMVKLIAIKTMSHPGANHLVHPGDEFEVDDWVATELIEKNLAKESGEKEYKVVRGYEKAVKPSVSIPRSTTPQERFEARREQPVAPEEDAEVTIIERKGSWYYFSDGEKTNGEINAASHLGITRRELNELTSNN